MPKMDAATPQKLEIYKKNQLKKQKMGIQKKNPNQASKKKSLVFNATAAKWLKNFLNPHKKDLSFSTPASKKKEAFIYKELSSHLLEEVAQRKKKRDIIDISITGKLKEYEKSLKNDLFFAQKLLWYAIKTELFILASVLCLEYKADYEGTKNTVQSKKEFYCTEEDSEELKIIYNVNECDQAELQRLESLSRRNATEREELLRLQDEENEIEDLKVEYNDNLYSDLACIYKKQYKLSSEIYPKELFNYINKETSLTEKEIVYYKKQDMLKPLIFTAKIFNDIRTLDRINSITQSQKPALLSR